MSREMCVPKMIKFLILYVMFSALLAKSCASNCNTDDLEMHDEMWKRQKRDIPETDTAESRYADEEELRKSLNAEREANVRARLMNDLRHLYTTCSCRTEYRIKDLGEGYYPRFINEARCLDTKCQERNYYPCRLLNYTIYVLSQRTKPTLPVGPEEDELPEAPLPEVLQRDWKLVPMTIQTGCMPDFQRNI